MAREFNSCFQISKTVLFEVGYYTIGENKDPHFATIAMELTRDKAGFKQIGQCQKDLLPEGSAARSFFDKWDSYHFGVLTDEQLEELKEDLKKLKETYHWLEITGSGGERFKHDEAIIPFGMLVKLSNRSEKEAEVSCEFERQ